MSGQVIQMPSRGGGETILTKKQLAQKLGRSERWIEIQVRDNKLPVLEATDRFGRRRYNLQAVEEWMSAGKPKPRRRDDRLSALEREVAASRRELASLRTQLDELRRAS